MRPFLSPLIIWTAAVVAGTLWFSVAGAQELPVSVSTFSRGSFRGSLVGLDNERLNVKLSDGSDKTVETRFVQSISFNKPVDTKRANAVGIRFWSINGSLFTIDKVLYSDKKLKLATSTGLAIEADDLSARAILFNPSVLSDPRLDRQWTEFMQKPSDSDTLYILKSGRLFRHAGTILEITDDRVPFLIGGEMINVKRERIVGIRWADRPLAGQPPKLAEVVDTAGNSFAVESINRIGGGKLAIQSCVGLAVELPLDSISRMDWLIGKPEIWFLDEMSLEQVKRTPFIEIPGGIDLVDRYYRLRKNRSVFGAPLTLDGKRYERGLSMVSQTLLTVRLPEGARRFQAIAGIDDETRPQGNVELVVRADDRELYRGIVTGKDKPMALDLDVKNAARLTILVDFGENMDVADHFDLVNAKIIP